MNPTTEIKTVAGESSLQDAKGKIVEYSFWLLKQGYAKATIHGRTKLLKRLTKLGANLQDSESVKETIAKQDWSIGRKSNAIDAYTTFLQMQGTKWTPPNYKRIRNLPFIPTEAEIDQLIAGCNNRMATFLQLLKETGVRCGEACSARAQEITALRRFRDLKMEPNPIGKYLITLYYNVSPPLARVIARSKNMKAFVRLNLKPIIRFLESSNKLES